MYDDWREDGRVGGAGAEEFDGPAPTEAECGREERDNGMSPASPPNEARVRTEGRYEVRRGDLTVLGPAPGLAGTPGRRRIVPEPDSDSWKPDPDLDETRAFRAGREGEVARDVPALDGSDSRCDSSPSPWLVEAPVSSSWGSTLACDVIESLLATRGRRLDRLTDLDSGSLC